MTNATYIPVAKQRSCKASKGKRKLVSDRKLNKYLFGCCIIIILIELASPSTFSDPCTFYFLYSSHTNITQPQQNKTHNTRCERCPSSSFFPFSVYLLQAPNKARRDNSLAIINSKDPFCPPLRQHVPLHRSSFLPQEVQPSSLQEPSTGGISIKP